MNLATTISLDDVLGFVKNVVITILIILGVSGLFVTCHGIPHYVSIEDILTREDAAKYVCQSTQFDSYSPIGFNVIKGDFPCNDYNWTKVYVRSYTPKFFHRNYFKGNEFDLITKAFPETEVIVSYGSSIFLGYKRIKE